MIVAHKKRKCKRSEYMKKNNDVILELSKKYQKTSSQIILR